MVIPGLVTSPPDRRKEKKRMLADMNETMPKRRDDADFRRFLFLQIPKTATRSVLSVVWRWGNISTDQTLRAAAICLGPTAEQDAAARFAHDHVSWSDAAGLISDPSWAPIMTFRDPVARVVSHYWYLRKRALDPALRRDFMALCRKVSDRPLSGLVLDDASLFHGWTMPVQTLLLGGNVAGRTPELPWPDAGRVSETVEAALSTALDRLDRLAWIGVTDTLQRDLDTMALWQGWPIDTAPHINRSGPANGTDPALGRLDAASRRVLTDRLAADYLLVDAAREIAAERHRAAIAAGINGEGTSSCG